MTKIITVQGIAWTKDKVRNNLIEHDNDAIKGMLKIYEFQTMDEKSVEVTMHTNGKGFNSSDGGIMSSMSEQYLKTGSLSPKQLITIHKIMPKYAGQLFKLIELMADTPKKNNKSLLEQITDE